jgi:hypothetical protein
LEFLRYEGWQTYPHRVRKGEPFCAFGISLAGLRTIALLSVRCTDQVSFPSDSNAIDLSDLALFSGHSDQSLSIAMRKNPTRRPDQAVHRI